MLYKTVEFEPDIVTSETYKCLHTLKINRTATTLHVLLRIQRQVNFAQNW